MEKSTEWVRGGSPFLAVMAIFGVTFAFAVLVIIYALALMQVPNSMEGISDVNRSETSTSEKSSETIYRREPDGVPRVDRQGQESRSRFT